MVRQHQIYIRVTSTIILEIKNTHFYSKTKQNTSQKHRFTLFEPKNFNKNKSSYKKFTYLQVLQFKISIIFIFG